MGGDITVRSNFRSWRGFLALGVLVILASGCSSIEEKRIRQLLHEKGFGTRADGVATAENYVAGGDRVQFIIEPNVYLQPGHEQLFLLTRPQPVQIDGTIFVPYIGPVYVLGMKETSLSEMMSQLLDGVFETPIRVQARIISTGKGFFMFGEVLRAARYIPMVDADITLLEVIARAPVTSLANLGRVKVIKPDAQDPLVVVVNVREMIETGNTTYNLRIDDNDIIYIPPTFLGHIARFLEKLLLPITVTVRAAFGFASFYGTYDYLVTGNPGFVLGGGGFRRF
jgi:protein involved in polysaccharide export with SLBB domain